MGTDDDLPKLYNEKQMQAAIIIAAKDAANETLSKFAAAIGIDLTNREQLELLRQDRVFLRSLRVGRDAMGAKIGVAVLLAFVAGIMTVLYNGAVALIQSIRSP